MNKEKDIQYLLTQDKGKLDDLTPKDILDIVGEAFDTAMDANTKLATEEVVRPLEELSAKINNISKYLLEKEVNTGFEDARRMFSDFDDYKEGMEALFKINGNLTPQQAYILAKADKVKKSPPHSETDSERPISLTARSEAAQTAYDKAKENRTTQKVEGTTLSGKRQFRQRLSEVADRVISAKRQ